MDKATPNKTPHTVNTAFGKYSPSTTPQPPCRCTQLHTNSRMNSSDQWKNCAKYLTEPSRRPRRARSVQKKNNTTMRSRVNCPS